MSGIGLCILCVLFHCNPLVNPIKEKKGLFYRWENWGLEELSNFTKRLISERAGTETATHLISKTMLYPTCLTPWLL